MQAVDQYNLLLHIKGQNNGRVISNRNRVKEGVVPGEVEKRYHAERT